MSTLTEARFNAILLELVEDNPFAIRPLLKILETRFTTAVPTLAVTCEERPRLLVNLNFLRDHCLTDDHIKAVICHEFLHVILRHTEERRPFTPARHLAFDAVINAILHRQYGEAYSSMMSSYYSAPAGLRRLLRPMTADERLALEKLRDRKAVIPQWVEAWEALYAGRLVADDIESLADTLGQSRMARRGGGIFRLRREVLDDALLGDHQALDERLSDELLEVLDAAMRQMNGHGIWRAPRSRGAGANPYEALFAAEDEPMRRWERTTLALLRQHLTPDRKSRAVREVGATYRLPVLTPRDRRAFVRSLWSPFLPEAQWVTSRLARDGTAQVYLDVSGSMHAETPAIIALLGRLARHIRRPFWAFSDVVAPARIVRGMLQTATTGGTSLSCVLQHCAATRPEAAIVITDGYVEDIDRGDVAAIGATRLHVLVTRDGNPSAIERAGLPCTQLERYPS